MEQIFRDQIINVDGKQITVSKKSIEEIFKYGDKPYLAVAASGSGKTVCAVDLLYKFAKYASKVYYISATSETIDEDDLRKIPNLFKRTPTFENLNNIWNEMEAVTEAAGKPINKLIELMSKIYPKEELIKINQELVAYERKIRSTEKCNDDDVLAFKLEVITRLIFNGIGIYGSSNLSEDDMVVVRTMISGKQKTLLLIDDVSAELEEMSMSKATVNFNGKVERVDRAYKLLLTNIMTRARHMNSIIVMFVHNFETIGESKDKIGNFLILDSESSESVRRFKTIPQSTRNAITEGGKLVFGKYRYHFVVVKNSGSEVYVSKADLHENDEIEVDELNRHYIECYNAIMQNLDVVDKPKQQNIDDLI